MGPKIISPTDAATTNGNSTTTKDKCPSTPTVSAIKPSVIKVGTDPDCHSCHEAQDSLLTSTSGYTNYRGVLNLFFILLVLSNARVALENIIKYGVLVDPIQWVTVLGNPTIWPSVQIILGLNVFILNSFWIEKHLLAPGAISEWSGRVLVALNAGSIIAVPALVVYTTDVHPVGSSVALAFVAQVFLKLISYHMVNYWCRKYRNKKEQSVPNGTAVGGVKDGRNGTVTTVRQRSKRPVNPLNAHTVTDDAKLHANNNEDDEDALKGCDVSEGRVVYPDNLNKRDIYYFIFAPTLCYELNFPRSQRIRKRFLIRRGIEVIFLLQLILALIQQWLVPTIRNSTGPLQEMHFPKMAERLLKLAIPNHIIWLIFFYWYFHSCTNFVGELMRFADREFYRDWWNANSVPYFWSNWNIPVHKWCLRHMYKPLLAHGWSRFQASVFVFCVSAFFHEYLVSVPLKMFRIWAFSGMLFQIPFAMFVSRLVKYPQWANTAVWLSLIIGQPLCILMYYHDYYVESLTASAA